MDSQELIRKRERINKEIDKLVIDSSIGSDDLLVIFEDVQDNLEMRIDGLKEDLNRGD